MPADPIIDVEVEIARLGHLDLDGLRSRWRLEFGRAAPAHLSKHLLLRLLAYRLQAQALSDLSPTTKRLLDTLVRGNSSTDKVGLSVPLPGQGRLMPGTVLVREHEGRQHHVMVVDAGFAWNGTTYPSLSKVASAITGTRWNGPRFFGLRDKDGEARS